MVLYFCKESQNYFNSFATLVPIGALRWYRFVRYSGTDSCAMMVPFRRYYHNPVSPCKEPSACLTYRLLS